MIAQLLHLESEDPDKDISIYINSPGGEITGLFAIYDTMQYIKPDVQTICVGQAASAAAVLLAVRHARASASPSRTPGSSSTSRTVARPVRPSTSRSRPRRSSACASCSTSILAHHTGQTVEKVAQDTDRDFIMSAPEAKDYGIVDEVITNRELASVAACRRA